MNKRRLEPLDSPRVIVGAAILGDAPSLALTRLRTSRGPNHFICHCGLVRYSPRPSVNTCHGNHSLRLTKLTDLVFGLRRLAARLGLDVRVELWSDYMTRTGMIVNSHFDVSHNMRSASSHGLHPCFRCAAPFPFPYPFSLHAAAVTAAVVGASRQFASGATHPMCPIHGLRRRAVGLDAGEVPGMVNGFDGKYDLRLHSAHAGTRKVNRALRLPPTFPNAECRPPRYATK